MRAMALQQIRPAVQARPVAAEELAILRDRQLERLHTGRRVDVVDVIDVVDTPAQFEPKVFDHDVCCRPVETCMPLQRCFHEPAPLLQCNPPAKTQAAFVKLEPVLDDFDQLCIQATLAAAALANPWKTLRWAHKAYKKRRLAFAAKLSAKEAEQIRKHIAHVRSAFHQRYWGGWTYECAVMAQALKLDVRLVECAYRNIAGFANVALKFSASVNPGMLYVAGRTAALIRQGQTIYGVSNTGAPPAAGPPPTDDDDPPAKTEEDLDDEEDALDDEEDALDDEEDALDDEEDAHDDEDAGKDPDKACHYDAKLVREMAARINVLTELLAKAAGDDTPEFREKLAQMVNVRSAP